MLKMYFFRAGSVSDLLRNSPAQRSLARRGLAEFLIVRRAEPALCGLVLNDFGDFDLRTGNPWDAAVVDFNLRGDRDCHWL
jgi:hypothetical protein